MSTFFETARKEALRRGANDWELRLRKSHRNLCDDIAEDAQSALNAFQNLQEQRCPECGCTATECTCCYACGSLPGTCHCRDPWR